MTKSMFSRAFAIVALVATMGFTHKTDSNGVLCEGFVPENDLKIPVGFFAANLGGISEQQYNDVLDRMEKIFRPEVERMGDTLRVNRRWTDPTVNASAQRMGRTQVINMYGGLARHPATNIEGFALVACHEYGHHNAGAPKMGSWSGSWATNEGGSDYFATLKCLRQFFAEDDNEAILRDVELDPVAEAACNAQFANDNHDRLICLRSSLAGQSVANLFQALREEETPPRFGTPDNSKVTKTNDRHPATQCRLDTYFAGMLCVARTSEPVENGDYRAGACYTPRDVVGFRPTCWFAAPR